MPERAPARSIYILLLLFLINLMNFFDRTIPAVVLEPIRKEFGLDDTALGILGASFTLIYAVAGVPLGYLADRFRRTRILAAGLTAWSLLTAASGLAWSFMSFFWIRLLVGVGEASCAPAANSLIGDLFPSEKRARALGIFMLGLPLGLLLAFSIVGALAQNYGWRVPFYLAAIPGFVVAALMLFAAEPVRGSQETYTIDAATPVDRPMRRILAIPTVWWIIASGATVNFAAYAMGTFLPTMLIRYHGLSIGKAGLIAAIVLGVTGLIGLTAGGWLADYLHKRFLRGRLLLASCSMLVATPLLYFGLAQPAGAADAATILLSLGWLLYFSYYCSVYSALQDVVEPRLRATAMAVYFFFQYVLGRRFRHRCHRRAVRHVRKAGDGCGWHQSNDRRVSCRWTSVGDDAGGAAGDCLDLRFAVFRRSQFHRRCKEDRVGRTTHRWARDSVLIAAHLAERDSHSST